jgi:uncharacterized protein YcaQ
VDQRQAYSEVPASKKQTAAAVDSGAKKVISLSREAARRFILGRQGLWPGRRWKGRRGTEAAMRAMEHLQLDPLQIAARSHDIALHSRVANYTPGLWEELCYHDRKFFDWGGWLAVRPIEEMPHWRTVMRRECDHPRWRAFARQHRKVIEEMRALARARPTITNRDFAMHSRRRIDDYRGRKDSAVALYYLWRIGELMTHRREHFERVYSLAENIAPAGLLYESSGADADAFLIKKNIAFQGLHRLNAIGPMIGRYAKPAEVACIREKLLADGEVIPVQVEGWKDLYYALASDAQNLCELSLGRTPRDWRPCETTTLEEVTLVAPLDVVMARRRAQLLFNFDYVWEVYKPLHLRKWGYYTLPILWGDSLVARIDLKLDRASMTLLVCGFWLENRDTATDSDFVDALIRGLARFMRFLGATRLDASAVKPRAHQKMFAAISHRSVRRRLDID